MLSRSSGYKRAFLRRTVLETRKDMMSEQVSVSKSNIRGAFGAFFIPGMYTALWAGFVPYLKAKLSIGEDVLGSMILLLGVGSCLSRWVELRWLCRCRCIACSLKNLIFTC